MLAALPFTSGVSMYAFQRCSPTYCSCTATNGRTPLPDWAAAIVAGAQIAGGLLVPHIGRIFRRRTSVLLAGTLLSAVILAIIGLVPHFWMAIVLLVLWGLMFAAVMPVRQAYLNGLIASEDRATVLSFDSLLGSSGAVAIS